MTQLINILSIFHLFTIFKIIWITLFYVTTYLCNFACRHIILEFPRFLQEDMTPGAILETFKLIYS